VSSRTFRISEKTAGWRPHGPFSRKGEPLQIFSN